MPYMTTLELKLALFLEYHPHVRTFQRGDMSPAFADAYHVCTPLGTPYRISYLFEEKAHEYLPDFVGTLCDGGLLIAEAGRESEKQKAQAQAKAEAARRLAQLKGGEYWIGTDRNLSELRFHNLLYLHVRRRSFPSFEEIALLITACLSSGEMYTVHELVRRFGARWSPVEVEAAAWKVAGDAAASGRLLVDLDEERLTLSTPLAFLNPDAPPILPGPLPSSLAGDAQGSENPTTGDEAAEALLSLPLEGLIPGPPFDGSSLATEGQKTRFYRNLAAVTAVLAGGKLREVARDFQMHPYSLSRLIRRAQEFGQIACVPHATYHRDRSLHPELQQLIRKLYGSPLRPTVMAVYEDVRLADLSRKLSKREEVLIAPPSYWQVYGFLKSIAHETKVVAARSGLKHPPQERMSPHSFVLSIPYPAHICQVDEHTLDLLVTTPDGVTITKRVHAAVMICVKTAAILGAVLALESLKEEDYLRLVKQALEPKDRLTALYECVHPWPSFGKPAVIFHDRGKIFTSAHATEVLVDRLGITTERAPAYAPSAKGTVEALFTWMTRKFEHRLPGTTKASTLDRGTYDSLREAEKAGITFDVLEKLFIQTIVDGYMQEVNTLRRQSPVRLWEDAVRETGVPRFMGSADDLKLLLMKAANRKNLPTGCYAIRHGALSFKGRSYVSPGLLDRLRGQEITIYFDRRDISVIYLFLEGQLVGEAYCTQFLHRRVSVWEADAERRADSLLKKEAAAVSLTRRQQILKEATSGRRILQLEARRLEKQRQLERQRHEIHPGHVEATLQALQKQPDSRASSLLKPAGFLPPAVPEDDLQDTEIAPLPVRKLWRDDG